MNNQNHLAVNQLKLLGFPLANIRKSLHKLIGISQPEMARQIGTSRPNITVHVDGRGHNPEMQKAIADIYGVPVDDLFSE